jgi:hypothetical protein
MEKHTRQMRMVFFIQKSITTNRGIVKWRERDVYMKKNVLLDMRNDCFIMSLHLRRT